jgi:CRP/FNR family transcriptional regulator
MLTMKEVTFIKDNLPFYAQLNIDELDLLMQAMSRRMLSKGAQLSEHYNDCNGLVLVETGRIRAYIMSADGKEITLFRLMKTEICILSASCLFKDFNFVVYFEVEKDCTIYLIPTNVIEDLSTYNMSVKEFLLERMASRFSSVMWVMEQVVFGTLSKRVASFLLEQTVIENSQTLSITHEEIAKNIGSAREVVSRMLKFFENDNIIQASRKTISINDLEKLTLLSH